MNKVALPFLYPLLLAALLSGFKKSSAQVKWTNVNDQFGRSMPAGFNVYRTNDSLDGKAFVAYYSIANLNSPQLKPTVDTTYKRRLTPSGFYEKNHQPILVVNTTFFSFATNQNLNVVIKGGKLLSYNVHSVPGDKDHAGTWRHPLKGALGISKKRKADIAWIYTDSTNRFAYALQSPVAAYRDSINKVQFDKGTWGNNQLVNLTPGSSFKKWKMQTAVGGGPVLVQNGQVQVTNNEEIAFAGKAIDDMHPRTLVGYTKYNQLVIMVIEGRNPGVAEGASLMQSAQLMVSVGCVEALNLDGGGSSCMLINGKETIKPSDKGIQRPVPAVLMIY